MRRILSSTTSPTNTKTMAVLAALAALTAVALTACGGAADPEAAAAVKPTAATVDATAEAPAPQTTPTTATTQPPTTAAPPTAPPTTATEPTQPTPAPEPVPAPAPTPAPEPAPAPAPAPAPVVPAYVVVDVIDGDTLDLDNGERVRLVGIDAPERGDCGADAATATLTEMALGKAVVLEPSDEDRDRYGRLLRYVVVDGVDAGGTLLMLGQAVPRYNSTDGYGRHPREDEYAAIAQPAISCPAPTPAPAPAPAPRSAPAPAPAPAPRPSPSPTYQNCDAVRAAGAAPIYPGDPGFQSKFDRDDDGVGCE